MATISGTVIRVSPKEKVTETFSKAKLVIDVPGQYPNTPEFEFSNNLIAQIEHLNAGDQVTVHYEPYGNMGKPDTTYAGRVFVSLRGFRLDVTSYADGRGTSRPPAAPATQRAPASYAPTAQAIQAQAEPIDDMPF